MVLNVFGRKDAALSEEAKQFIHSLPSSYVNLFRKRRELLPVWSSNKYCVLIKSTYLLYYRAAPNEIPGSDQQQPDILQQLNLHLPHQELQRQQQQQLQQQALAHVKFLNLRNCTIRMIDDDTAGYVFCVTPESGKGGILFAADTEKDRAKFAAQAAAIQRRAPPLTEFETLKLLGRGHYGRVILARGQSDKQLYAVKEMKLNQVKAKVVYAERCVMEWVADHPFILGLDYAFIQGKSVFLVSRFMPGGDLFLHMQNNGGSFNEDAVRFYGAELLLALEHMHNMSILHRDIKPENVLLGEDGHIQLADMGLAKRLESRSARTKTMCGTDTYLPPEMVGRFREGHGLAVDMWQLGCILFELRAGYPPFYQPQSSQKSTHQRIMHHPVHYPNNLSREFKSLLMGLLEKKQAQRLGFHHGVAEVKAHPFFAGMDWDQLRRKQVTPPLVPGPAGEHFVNNFDPQFTAQSHQIHVTEPATPGMLAANHAFDRDFAGFDYVRPSLAMDSVVEDSQDYSSRSEAATATATPTASDRVKAAQAGRSPEEEMPEVDAQTVMIRV